MKNRIRVIVETWKKPEPVNPWDDPIEDEDLDTDDLVSVKYPIMINLDDIQFCLQTRDDRVLVTFKDSSVVTIISDLDKLDNILDECYSRTFNPENEVGN